jgi:hypothetical protein
VAEDLSYVVMLRRKFGYLESIPGVLLPHPSSAAFPPAAVVGGPADAGWPPAGFGPPPMDLYDPYGQAAAAAAAAAAQMHIVPSMSSLEALLSKLPSVDPAAAAGSLAAATMMAKDEAADDGAGERGECHGATVVDAAAGTSGGEGTSVAAAAAAPYYVNVAKPSEGF